MIFDVSHKYLILLARPTRFELVTFAFGGQSALGNSRLFKGLYGGRERNIAGNAHIAVTERLLAEAEQIFTIMQNFRPRFGRCRESELCQSRYRMSVACLIFCVCSRGPLRSPLASFGNAGSSGGPDPIARPGGRRSRSRSRSPLRALADNGQ